MKKETKEIVNETVQKETIEKEPVAEPMTALEKQISALTEMVAEMAKKDAQKDEQIKMLISIADEGRKERFNSKLKSKIIPRVKVTKLNGKIVVGSRTIIDEVYKDLSDKGNWVEKQIHCYTLDDGSTVDLALPQYNRTYEKVEADVVKIAEVPEKEGPDGEKFYRYTVKLLEDGRELELDYQFIN